MVVIDKIWSINYPNSGVTGIWERRMGMDERETILRPEYRRRQTENPLLQKESRKKKPVSRRRKNEYKLMILKIILIVLIILLIAAFIFEFGQTGVLHG